MEHTRFSNLDREQMIATALDQEYDLVVIGGGITGAGILLDAASRGMRCILLEKGDFASGTSSKSTKLIHGGLRYLKQFDFWLVKEVGSERAIVHRLAPHLVIPEKMLLPLVENGSYGKWLTSIGLKVYDILAQVSDDDKRRMLDAEEALTIEPLLPKKRVKGAGYYAEYRTDDARLTLEAVKTALRFQAQALNYTKVLGFTHNGDRISGVAVQDLVLGKHYQLRAKYVVNATGPWVDELRELDHSKKGKRLHLTKGVHLVFPHEKLPVSQSIYFDIPDGRMMFAIPRGRVTYIGTTDTNFDQDKDHVGIDLADALYLISAVNHMFPSIDLDLSDIESSWAGLRPLIHEEGKSPSELSRKDEIFVSPSGLVSIAGGKLTGYRKMAERVVDHVAENLKETGETGLKDCHTQDITLCGNHAFKKYKHVKNYIQEVFARIGREGFSEYHARYLVHNYGNQTQTILEIYDSLSGSDILVRLAKAELRFCMYHEMIVDPMDFFERRTGRMYFDIGSVTHLMEPVLDEFALLTGADGAKKAQWRSEVEERIGTCSRFSV